VKRGRDPGQRAPSPGQRPRVFVRPEAVRGDRVQFEPEEARHLGRVRRLRPGDLVDATDGTGQLYTIRLTALDERSAWGRIEARATPGRESPCAITLAQAVLKGDRMAWLVQKATELGVARIVPVETGRVVARLAPEAAPQRRWERIAREAVKQSGRVVVPVVERPRSFADAVGEARGHDLALVCWERGGPTLDHAVPPTCRPARLLLLVGPEGGFTPEEVALAEGAGARPVSLGPRILRAESAGLVAIALAQYRFGDLGGTHEPAAGGAP
jgi:16S rRNA (uracil1498-N3)-methyltransferase